MMSMAKKGRRRRTTTLLCSKRVIFFREKKKTKQQQQVRILRQAINTEGRIQESLGSQLLVTETVVSSSTVPSAELVMEAIPMKAPAVASDMAAANLTKQTIKGIQVIRVRDGSLGLSHFKLLKRLGCGDIGSVYLAELRGSAMADSDGAAAIRSGGAVAAATVTQADQGSGFGRGEVPGEQQHKRSATMRVSRERVPGTTSICAPPGSSSGSETFGPKSMSETSLRSLCLLEWGFMSGPMERVVSGPLEAAYAGQFSAPLAEPYQPRS
ncbi:unnamed protein product [Sphagnum balticum]